MTRLHRLLPFLILALNGCEAATPQSGETAGVDTASAPAREQHIEAAGHIVAFLRGAAPLDGTMMADSVTLFIAPEGGGESRRVAAADLHARDGWRVGGHRLVPFEGPAELSARAGRHFNCLEYPLASRYPDLARLPHVGTKLQAPDAAGCLGTWNMTFVFAASRAAPALVAVVYDQWEW